MERLKLVCLIGTLLAAWLSGSAANSLPHERAMADSHSFGLLSADVVTPLSDESTPARPNWLVSQLERIRDMGAAGGVVFVLLYAAATVAFVPGSLLTLGAGAVFGAGWGMVLVSIASVLSAAIAFLLGRYFVRKPIENKVRGNKRFQAIDDAVGKEGWKIVLLTRLSPAFPFGLQNYAYGLTKVGFIPYVLASWIGMIPGTVLYVYLGTAAGSLAEISAGTREKTTAEIVFFWFGLAVTTLVTIYVTRLAKRALSKHVPAEVPDTSESDPTT